MIKNIVPSKPFKNFADIENLAAVAVNKVEKIQVDICDGEYVKNVSWPFTEISKNDFANLYKKKELDIFMPQMYDVSYTADLMCVNPQNYIETLVQYGFEDLIFHYGALMLNPNIQEEIVDIYGLCQKYDLKMFLAVKVNDDIDKFIKYAAHLKNINFIVGVQVMGIENIGLQGQKFDERSLDIVKRVSKEIKQGDENFQILFDGGINEETLEKVKEAGVDVFCVGHLLTDGDFTNNLKYIKKNV